MVECNQIKLKYLIKNSFHCVICVQIHYIKHGRSFVWRNWLEAEVVAGDIGKLMDLLRAVTS